MNAVFYQGKRRFSLPSTSRYQEKCSSRAQAGGRSTAAATQAMNRILRLRKHADYQRVYQSSRKQFSRQMTFFFALREEGERLSGTGPRVGLTVGKVMGKAVDRNRIKRRMREAVRKSIATLDAPVDVVLHPRRAVLELEFAVLEREVGDVFRTIRSSLARQAAAGAAQ